MPHVIVNILAYYSSDTGQCGKIVNGARDIEEIYDRYKLLVLASMPCCMAAIGQLNEIKYVIDSPLHFHPALSPVHYGAVVSASDKIANSPVEIPFEKLPNLRSLELFNKHVDVLPINIKKLKLDSEIEIPRVHAVTHFNIHTSHIDWRMYRYSGIARAGDVFGAHIEYLEVRGVRAARVSWDGVERDACYKVAGPITPDTDIYYDECAGFAFKTFDETSEQKYKDEEIQYLELVRRYEYNDICVFIHTERIKKDGTFAPTLSIAEGKMLTVDYSHVESTTITDIDIDITNISKLHVLLPHDCTNMASLKINAWRARIVITHPDAIRYNGLKYPFLNGHYVNCNLAITE